MQLQLDRMSLDDVGSNPVKLAGAIHDQLGQTTGPVDVRSIALALDIVEVRAEAIRNFEGALITTPERSEGAILVNINSSHHRRRFTIAHELLHFLSPWHQPKSPDGFQCTRQDMSIINSSERNRHIRQEAEANEFAIELLAPRGRLTRYLAGEPDLDRVLEMNTDLVISKHAASASICRFTSIRLRSRVQQNRSLSILLSFPGLPIAEAPKRRRIARFSRRLIPWSTVRYRGGRSSGLGNKTTRRQPVAHTLISKMVMQ